MDEWEGISGDPPDPRFILGGEKAECRGASIPHSIQSTYGPLYIPMILRMLFTIPGTRVRATWRYDTGKLVRGIDKPPHRWIFRLWWTMDAIDWRRGTL